MKLEEQRKKINSKYPNSVYPLTSAPSISRIRTGIFVLDLLTNGGIPVNRITIFYGEKSTGKTTICLKAMHSFLKNNPDKKAVFVDFEHALDRDWAMNIMGGEYASRVEIVDPDYGEQGVNLIYELAQSDDVGMIVVDSVAEVIPTAEVVDDAEDHHMCLQAKLINKLLRKLILSIVNAKRSGRELTCLLINQVTVNIGARQFQPQLIKPGGKKQDLIASVIIRTYAKKYIKIKNSTVKVVHTFTVEKNKVGTPKNSGEYCMYLVPYNGNPAGYINDSKTIIDVAKDYEFIERFGKKFKVAGKSFDTLLDIQNKIRDDEEFREGLIQAILESEVTFEGEETTEEVLND